MDDVLTDTKAHIDSLVASAKKSITAKVGRVPHVSPEDIEQQIKSTAAEIAARPPSNTQKIIAFQVELSGSTYQQVTDQSRLSFRLSTWLVIVGAILFAISMIIAIIPFSSGNTSLLGTLGIISSLLIEAVADFSFLYNKATKQLAEFQVYLDRINRTSICYAMADELHDKTEKQQEIVSTIIQSLLREK